jgi:hypothetical protein
MLRIPHCLDNRLTDGGKVVSPKIRKQRNSNKLWLNNKEYADAVSPVRRQFVPLLVLWSLGVRYKAFQTCSRYPFIGSQKERVWSCEAECLFGHDVIHTEFRTGNKITTAERRYLLHGDITSEGSGMINLNCSMSFMINALISYAAGQGSCEYIVQL